MLVKERINRIYLSGNSCMKFRFGNAFDLVDISVSRSYHLSRYDRNLH